MSRKATHTGHCQLCGRMQKLPGDRLSLHGYTVEWNFFSGTCSGSSHQPYEMSCDLIVARIPDMEASVVAQDAVIAELTANPLPVDKMMVHIYDSPTWGEKGGYRWIETSIRDNGDYLAPLGRRDRQNPNYVQQADAPEGFKWVRGSVYSGDARSHYTGLWIAELNRRAAQSRQYLAWLRERAANWTAQPLTLIEK